MLIDGTKHYYISSEGRLANNIKGKFYVHNETLSKATNRVHWKVFYEDESGVEYKRDVYADNLVAQTFFRASKRVKTRYIILTVTVPIANIII